MKIIIGQCIGQISCITMLENSHMASSTCLTSLFLEQGDGKSCRVPPHHYLMHSYYTGSEVSAGFFSWVFILASPTSSYPYHRQLWQYCLVSHSGLWDDTWRALCWSVVQRKKSLQFFHDSEKNKETPKVIRWCVICFMAHSILPLCIQADHSESTGLDWLQAKQTTFTAAGLQSFSIPLLTHTREITLGVVHGFLFVLFIYFWVLVVHLQSAWKWNLGISVFLWVLPKCFTTLNPY